MSIGRNVLKLTFSKIATLLIGFVTAPIIARLFGPKHFGVYQIFVSIAGVISAIACLRYELSIPLAKDEKEASASFTLSVLISLFFFIVVLAVIPFGKEKIAQWFKSPELKSFLWLLPISVFIVSFRSSLGYWAAREERFGVKAWSDFSASLGGKVTTITWVLIIGASAAGLFTGYFTSLLVGILVLLAFLSRKLASDIKSTHLNFEMLWTIAKRHKKFPIFSSWSGLLNVLSVQLPPIILGLYFSTTVVGYYSLGKRFIGLPMQLLGNSIAQVFFPAMAKEYNKTGDLSKIVSNMFKRLVQIGVFPMVALGFLGVPLFGFVFGEKWIEAGVYAQILSGWMFFVFITSPLSKVFSILKRQEIGLAFNIVTISSRLFGLILGAILGGPRLALTGYMIASVITRCALMRWILYYSDVSRRWSGMLILKYMLLSSCLLLIPIGSIFWFFNNRFLVLGGFMLAALIYTWILIKTDPTIHNEFTKLFIGIPKLVKDKKIGS